ncbi:2-C-methyl-D-erythritol 4-phosphate cytidylyltransferase [Nitrosomonas aestuarii]|uniref:2-C-methyl-D-erythritol 4-phosphate cytidylyltransferase n=1 Tax=Nitrosomonas aestuarii TaxID=52441 RepID=UPI000D305FBE|nr:2-C-methyl-D-erythritol 4-phosphate cytidylyltransferase [Nitrosomonas aestuarii]PTN10889.1 2-C-methyl-D-erythritol 4-phosphate cytidylyltransferase [Nitrosomonas aestuarii]
MPNYFALIPAAGYGSRMENQLPKQYLTLAARPMIYHAVKTLCQSHKITRVFVVLSPQDPEWQKYDWDEFSDKLTVLYCGGETRAQSVLNGLAAVPRQFTVEPNDWVLVHDAARPLLMQSQLNQLMDELAGDPVGGLLAVPVADTLKRSDANNYVRQTESREHLWQAQTPQMFRYQTLVDALNKTIHMNITDDASAIEAMGLRPRLVHCKDYNFKITYPQDLELAKLIIQKRRPQ